jgi:hypothetical protein
MAQKKRSAVKSARLYCTSPHGFYFEVNVFRSKRGMYKYLRLQGHDFGGKCEAICCGYRIWSGDKNKSGTSKEIGCLCFYEGYLGAGVVAHECTHAGMRYLDEKKLRLKPRTWKKQDHFGAGLIPEDDPEEVLAFVVGNLAVQFWQFYYSDFGDNAEIKPDNSGEK